MVDTRIGLLGLVLAIAPLSGPPAMAQADTVTYELTLEITWSVETAPFQFPANPHLSRLFGATHNSRYTLFRDGHTASSGLELMAENGRGSVLMAEFAEAARRGRVGTVFEGPNLAVSPGVVSTTFAATSEHPLLSFVTMIAPSPDWFIGGADLPLLVDGTWIDAIELELWAWDSGTDSGLSYDSPNAETQPQQSVRLLATPHVLTAGRLVSFGTAHVRRVSP